MRGRLSATTGSGLLALAMLAGCAADGPGQRDVAATTSVCQGVEDCRVVDREDVDGDGRPDQVGFVVVSEERVVVRVRTADADTLRHALATMWFPRGEYYGATPIDGVPGAEVVVPTAMGAHTLWFTTLAVRDGRLVHLSPPGGGDEWMVDGAYSFNAGVTRRVENGQAVVVLTEASRNGVGPRFSGRDRSYVWRDGRWEHQQTKRTRYRTAEEAGQTSGWHVPGLPRWPKF